MRFSENRSGNAHWAHCKYKNTRIGVEIKNETYKTSFLMKIRLYFLLQYTWIKYTLINKKLNTGT